MKPFKVKTKNGEKWCLMNGSSLVEVDAADVPGIVARMEEAEREEAATALAPEPCGLREKEPMLNVRYSPNDVFGNRVFRSCKIDAFDNWLD
jgi:hypothetical protein